MPRAPDPIDIDIRVRGSGQMIGVFAPNTDVRLILETTLGDFVVHFHVRDHTKTHRAVVVTAEPIAGELSYRAGQKVASPRRFHVGNKTIFDRPGSDTELESPATTPKPTPGRCRLCGRSNIANAASGTGEKRKREEAAEDSEDEATGGSGVPSGTAGPAGSSTRMSAPATPQSIALTSSFPSPPSLGSSFEDFSDELVLELPEGLCETVPPAADHDFYD